MLQKGVTEHTIHDVNVFLLSVWAKVCMIQGALNFLTIKGCCVNANSMLHLFLLDNQVKVWCTKQEASVLNIDMKANICCVKCNPGSSNYIAV